VTYLYILSGLACALAFQWYLDSEKVRQRRLREIEEDIARNERKMIRLAEKWRKERLDHEN